MNNNKILVLVIAFVILITAVIPVAAITDGEPDGEGHPFVGLMVAKDASGTPLWRCSGTLISSKVFLTAGHCTEKPADKATIWFESDIQNQVEELGYPYGGKTSVEGTAYTHPDYDPNAFFLHDVGVVVLDRPVKMKKFGALPDENQLDNLKTKRGGFDVTFTAVGYGMQKSFPDASAWKDQSTKIRMVAYPKLNQINVPGSTGDFSMLLSNNANTGGTCFGDSGGPNFLNDTNIVAGVTSYGKNGTCAGTGGVFRLDRASALDWVKGFLK